MQAPDAAFSSPSSDDAQAVAADEAWLRALLVDEIEDLTRLAKLAMEMSEAITTRAKAELSDAAPSSSDPEAAPAPAARVFDLALGRVSRVVRLTYARRAASIEALRSFNDDRKAAADAVEARRRRRASLKRIVADIAGEQDGADAEGGEGERRERELGEGEVAEACERLTEHEDFSDLMDRPLSEAVAEACSVLGLTPDWRRLAKQPWARREMAGGPVGEPLATMKDAPPETIVRVHVIEPRPRPDPPFAEPTAASPPPDPDPPPPAKPAPFTPGAEPTWLPGEGPPPRRPRPRPYWA